MPTANAEADDGGSVWVGVARVGIVPGLLDTGVPAANLGHAATDIGQSMLFPFFVN